MSEMVERVAKAIANYWLENGFDPSQPDEGAARAAIEAMREPSAAMQDDGYNASTAGYREEAKIVWQAMIDAALATEPVA